jgi:hypothetical protein
MQHKAITKVARLDYRIESDFPIVGPLVNAERQGEILLTERSLAIVVAAKSQTRPYGKEIRVVYVPTGEVVYSKNSYTSQTTVLECA